MKKVIIINAIISVTLCVVTMFISARHEGNMSWSDQLSAGYMGGSVATLVMSLCGVYDSKQTNPKKKLWEEGFFVMIFDLMFLACICALLIEWLHVGPFGVIGFLFVNGICMLVYSTKNKKKREELPE